MSLIVALILGAFIGWLAGQLLGRDEGILGSVVVGVIGSIIGSFISLLFTGSDRAYLAFSWGGLLWSFIGAVVLVAILNAFQRPRRNRKLT